MDLIHPHTPGDVQDALREANAEGSTVLVVGGRTHMDLGNPTEVDAELWTTQLDELIDHQPAEMIAVVEAGMRVGDLEAMLSETGQEWPVDAPAEATVGGVIAAGASSPRRLKVGAVRDTVLQAEVVTGDGRVVRSGARTVKNVTGYDVHKLLAGSLGTLGVIIQAALKLRPRPGAATTFRCPGDLELAAAVLDAVPGAAAVLVTSAGLEVRLEGWPEEVQEQARAVRSVAGAVDEGDGPFPADRPWEDRPTVVQVAVPPSRLGRLVGPPLERWGALVGVGTAWIGARDAAELGEVRRRAAELGGIAPAIKGPGGLGESAPPAAELQRRIKAALDPGRVLAPGRFWGGI
ncbi:MAG TPA: FAD-binding protein [Actinomycetota bacterium]|jgi:glycolate oxidase FAD binding subunit|nr:FAD-binding protein [Actinomycetota bacterium]